MSLRLFLEGKELELTEDVQVAITKQFEELSNPTIIINDWSKTVSIPFTHKNDAIFGYFFRPDKLTTYMPSSNYLSTAPSRIKKWNGSDYVDDSLSSGNIVCDINAQYVQVGFQYQDWKYSNVKNYTCNNDWHSFEFIYDATDDYRFEFSFRDMSSDAPNNEVYFVQWDLHNLSLVENETYVVSFKHKKSGNDYIIYDYSLSKKQSLTGINFDPLQKLDFRLEWNGSTLMQGYAKLNEIKQKDGNGTYNITLFGQLGKIFQEMKKITFDTTTDDTQYLIHGEDYVSTYIDKNLVANSWSTATQESKKIKKKGETGYKVTDIIGFAPNNSFSEGFDYETYQNTVNTSKQFTETLGDAFMQATGIEPDTAMPNGMLSREIGEYRSYLQLPFIYWNKLFQMFQAKAEEVTGYKFLLDDTWFNTANPYWYNLVYMLKPFNTKKSEGATNYYNPHINDTYWIGSTNTNVNESYVMIPTTTETFSLVEDFDIYPSIFAITDKNEVYINYSLGLELHDNGSSNPYSLRLFQHNYMNIKVDLLDSNNNILKTESYAICDYECSHMNEIKNAYKQENILTYNELTRTGEYPQRLRYISINPTFTYMLKSYEGLEYKLRIFSNWKYSTYRFMTKYTSSDAYVGTIPETVLKSSNNSLISAQLSFERRSNSYFTLNDLWNNDYPVFSEILKYCKMFRICITVNDREKTINFETFQKYFKDYSIIDWTEKVDKSKDFTITPVSFENKYILFNYNDSKTKLGAEYKEKYGVNYGEYRLKTDYNFNTETVKLFDKITPSITNTDNVLSWNNLNDYHRIIYSFPAEIYVYNKDKDNKQQDIFGAYYFHNGIKTFDTESALHLRSVSISDDTVYQRNNNTYFYTQQADTTLPTTTYPYLDIVRGDNICLFNKPSENYTYANNYNTKNCIYKNFWETYLSERYNRQNKKVTCYVRLKPSEYMNFKWGNFIKIDDTIYVVNKIYDYDVTSNQSVKVDLMTVQSIEGYTANDFLYNIDTLDLGWSDTTFISGDTGRYGDLGHIISASQVTFSNGTTTYTVGGVRFTIVDNDIVHYETVSKYVDKEDLDIDITLKNKSNRTATFHVVRYATYPYPWIIIEDSNGNEVSTIYPGSRTYKLKWHGTETEGLDNVPTVTIEKHGTGSAAIGNDWVENSIMIQEGGDEYFRNEYEVTLNTNMTNYSGTYLRFIVTDKEGWHETRDYAVQL